MKKTSCLIISVLYLSLLSVNAQQIDSTSEGTSKNSLKKHSWSLQFEIGYSFQLQSFQNLTLSTKYHISDRSAIRLGFGIGFSNDDATTTLFGHSTPLNHSDQNFIVTLNYFNYLNPRSVINLYVGGGPNYSYSYSNYENQYSNNYISDYIEYDRSTSWNTGLQGIIGVEWFPVMNFGLFAEYAVNAEYGKTWEKRKEFDYNYQTLIVKNYDHTNWRVNGNSARLGLSVYF